MTISNTCSVLVSFSSAGSRSRSNPFANYSPFLLETNKSWNRHKIRKSSIFLKDSQLKVVKLSSLDNSIGPELENLEQMFFANLASSLVRSTSKFLYIGHIFQRNNCIFAKWKNEDLSINSVYRIQTSSFLSYSITFHFCTISSTVFN